MEEYIQPEIEIIHIGSADIITTSGEPAVGNGDIETPEMP